MNETTKSTTTGVAIIGVLVVLLFAGLAVALMWSAVQQSRWEDEQVELARACIAQTHTLIDAEIPSAVSASNAHIGVNDLAVTGLDSASYGPSTHLNAAPYDSADQFCLAIDSYARAAVASAAGAR